MREFIVATGTASQVDALNWDAARRLATDQGLMTLEARVPVVQHADCVVRGLQAFRDGDAAGEASPRHGKVVFLHGTVFGDDGASNETALPLDAARDAIARLAGRREEFTPYAVDGDCALAIADEATGRLEVFGDRAGFRRLFTYRRPDVTLAASKLRLLLALGGPWQVDLLAARLYLAGREPPWPRSIVQDVRMLPPVHRIDAHGREVSIRNYWQSTAGPAPASEAEAQASVRDALLHVVRRQARGRRTVLFLSGGRDSTSLARLVADVGDIHAISAGFEGSNADESGYAERSASHFGLPFVRTVVAPSHIHDMMMRLPALVDYPSHNPVNYMLISEAARREGFEAAISGQGGDECFARKPIQKVGAAWHLMWLLPRLPGGRAVARLAARIRPGRATEAIGLPPAPSTFDELCFRARGAFDIATGLLGQGLLDEIHTVASERRPVFDAVRRRAATDHEWHHAWSLWRVPDEYNTDFTITASGMTLLMPFTEGYFLKALFSASRRYAFESREWEAQLCGGVPDRLFLPRKQGFGFPMDVFCQDVMADTCRALLDEPRWAALRMKREIIEQWLSALENRSGDAPALRKGQAAILWRLLLLRGYLDVNGITLGADTAMSAATEPSPGNTVPSGIDHDARRTEAGSP